MTGTVVHDVDPHFRALLHETLLSILKGRKR